MSCENSNDVLASASKAIVTVPNHWNKFPTVDIVDTDYDFDYVSTGKNQKWLFNATLNKVFIKIKSVVKVIVSYKPLNESEKLFVRAMIVYDSSDHIKQGVKRCFNHRYGSVVEIAPEEHILRCLYPHNAQYMGDENGQLFGERLSIVVPLVDTAIDKDGKASKSILLDFACMNSCASGIGRRSTLVVFTLENEKREVIGKKILPFTVCSNPKTEMARENTFCLGKRKSDSVLDGIRHSNIIRLPDAKVADEPGTITFCLPIRLMRNYGFYLWQAK